MEPAIDGWEAAKAAWAVVMTLVSGWGIYQMRRIDKLEANKADKVDVQRQFEELQASIESSKQETIRSRNELKDDMREQRKETNEIMGRLFDRLDRIIDSRHQRGAPPHS